MYKNRPAVNNLQRKGVFMEIDTGTLNVTTKSGVKIVDNVRIKVAAGKAYALLGKDPRAKRLVMRIAAANLKGAAIIDDESKLCGLPLPPYKAYVFDTNRLFSFMTCREYLKYGSSGFKTDPQTLDKKIEALLETVTLSHRANKKISALTDAEYLCLCVAFSLLIDCGEVLINADTLKFGRESREVLNGLIQSLKNAGKAVLVNLADPRLCGEAFDTVGIMNNGALVLEGEPAELISGEPKVRLIRPTLASVYNKVLKQLKTENLKLKNIGLIS